jgi:hypothetical protein
MITFAFDSVRLNSMADGSIRLTFGLGELQPDQLGECAKLFNRVGCLGITLEEDFSDKEKEVLNKAVAKQKDSDSLDKWFE